MKSSHPICYHRLSTCNQFVMVAFMIGGELFLSYFHFKKKRNKKGLVLFCMFNISSSGCMGKDMQLQAICGVLPWACHWWLSWPGQTRRSWRVVQNPPDSDLWGCCLLCFQSCWKLTQRKGFIGLNVAFKMSEANWHYRKHQKKKKKEKTLKADRRRK